MESFLQKALVYFSAAVWLLVLALMGVGVPLGFWKPVGIVSLVVSVVIFAYDKWAWAWIPMKVSGVSDLRGTWRGTILSNWTDPRTGAKPAPVEAYFSIRQTASKIEVAMMTRESRSSTITAKIERCDGGLQVIGVYRNEPRPIVRDRSPIHYGGLRLSVGGPPATTLHGDYWTDRSTTGEISLTRCLPTPIDDFSTAQARCAAASPLSST